MSRIVKKLFLDLGNVENRPVAQLAERRSPKPKVGGSMPSWPAVLYKEVLLKIVFLGGAITHVRWWLLARYFFLTDSFPFDCKLPANFHYGNKHAML